MTDVALDDDGDEYEADDPLGPSLAMPPLYVLRIAARCPACGQAMHVYTIGCAAYHDAEDRRPIEDFHFLRRIAGVPDEVMELLKAKCTGFFLDEAEYSERPYLMNHCRCGAKLDDDYLHGDVGAAFWPDTPDGYGNFQLFLLPIDEPIPTESSYMIGGGEYLDYDHARPLTDL
jgi:hypothetical protein